MSYSNLAPLSVVEYSKSYIIEFVRHFTRWHERGEISKKAQLEYICKYLEVDHISCQTIVVENEYIDRHYLEDYAEYYARCFPAHPRKCARLHFFSEKFGEDAFRACLNGYRPEMFARLSDSYLGFAVIRPIPHTVLARVCLQPYPALLADPTKKILTRRTNVSLFGITLSVDTIPFIEQDKVVAACATSALWVALGAHPEMPGTTLPSPSAITKAAANGTPDASRTFPSPGLTPPQILRGLRHFGLEPTITWNDSRSLSELKAVVYAYVSNDTPIILGGDIYKETSAGAAYIGSHLVCVTGYGLSEPASAAGHRSFTSDRIGKLYVHDDRCGPYVRVSLTARSLNPIGKSGCRLDGFEMLVHGHERHLFVPNISIVGLYHKARVPHEHIYGACNALAKYLHATHSDLTHPRRSGTAQQKSQDEQLAAAIKLIEDGEWGIALTTSNAYKSDILNSYEFIAFNGGLEKESLLHHNMPRFIWLCRITNPKNGKRITDIIFDATEVPQGNMLVGYVCWSENAYTAWDHVNQCIRSRRWQAYKSNDPDAANLVGCFTKFFSQDKNYLYLNTQYGPLGLPRRDLKPGETDYYDNVTDRTDIYVVRRGDRYPNWDFLDQAKKYIWVINEAGDIVIGEDVHENDEFKGHPTLIDGKPGRIAGELEYKKVGRRTSWYINLQSRAYSGHVQSSNVMPYLANVASHNLPNLDAKVDKSWVKRKLEMNRTAAHA